MNIAFVGTELKGNFALDTCGSRGDHLDFIGEYNHINAVTNIILSTQYTAIIYDVDMFIDDSIIVANEVERIYKANNTKVIIYASGFNLDSAVIVELRKKNYVNFIFAMGLASKKNELEKCLNGYYESNENENITNRILKKESTEPPIHKVFKSIGVCGALSRIGTTTQCMQMIKYLTLKGYTAAYIEMNEKNYINGCINLYSEVKQHANSGKIEYANITMYRSTDIPEALKSNFEYLVYDYGTFLDNGFQKISYLEKDIQIMVCGAKANEIDYVQQLLQSQYYRAAHYLFSFVPDVDRNDLKEMMSDRENKTSFAEYQPDPFSYSSNLNKLYENFLFVSEQMDKRKKPRFFKKG